MTIEELILNEIAKKDKYISSYTNQLLDLKDLIAKINKEKEELYKEMRRVCSHPADKLYTTKEYEEGSYLDKSKTIYTERCTQCNTDIRTKTELGTYA